MKIIIFLACLFSVSISANMRRCMLLPVRDSIGGALGFKVFEDVEEFLKESGWCYYTSNSEILNILSSYKKNLDSILENPEVLKIISEKTKTGSLIKVEIQNQVKGVDLSVKVLGDNGEDVYFQEKIRLDSDDSKVISQTVKNWLSIYEKQIPYDGKVIGVLGNQFSINVGTNRSLFPGNQLVIIRPVRKKRHPLLKEVIDWETEKIGEAKVIHSSERQSQANVVRYSTRKKLKIGDWVISDRPTEEVVEQNKFIDKDEYKFGKLGEVSLLLNLGKGSATFEETSTNKIGGTVLGVELRSTLWITRNYWVGLDISRIVGSLSQEEGTLVNESNSMSNSLFRLKLGYKYLPMGFFYGPQVDAYVGYASYSYGLDTSLRDGFVETKFAGILMGVKASIPLQKVIRAYIELSFLFAPSYSDEVTNMKADSARNYTLEVGGSYIYAPNISFDLGYGVNSSKASFIDPIQSISPKISTFKLGSTFTF